MYFLKLQTRLWRKTRRPSANSPSCIGADPNRNFAYQWGGEGASSNPCSETYRGDSPFSEPETKALSDFLTSIKSLLKAYFAVHSYGQYWLYPWVKFLFIFYLTDLFSKYFHLYSLMIIY